MWGEVFPSPSDYAWVFLKFVVSSPGRKWILCTFEVRKKPSGTGTPLSVFLSDGGPKRLGARENLPHPLLSTGIDMSLNVVLTAGMKIGILKRTVNLLYVHFIRF